MMDTRDACPARRDAMHRVSTGCLLGPRAQRILVGALRANPNPDKIGAAPLVPSVPYVPTVSGTGFRVGGAPRQPLFA